MIGIAKKTTGWIGIDVGTSQVKVAQVVKDKQRWKLASAAVIPRSITWNSSGLEPQIAACSARELATASSLLEDLRGRKAAAVLPMSLCETYQFDGQVSGSANRETKLRQLVESASCEPIKHMQYDCWPTQLGSNESPVRKTNVIGVPQAWSDQLCHDIAHTGWSCQTVDAMPLALARAVSLVLPRGCEDAWAALDWGYSRATFCVVRRRVPIYVRCLKDCGFRNLLSTLSKDLDISEAESTELLQEQDFAWPPQDNIEQLVRDTIREPLEKVVFELRRTFSHLRSQRHLMVPVGCYLFGGGTTLPGVENFLSEKTECEHRIWELEQSPIEVDPSQIEMSTLLGPAVALSALAWEKR